MYRAFADVVPAACRAPGVPDSVPVPVLTYAVFFINCVMGNDNWLLSGQLSGARFVITHNTLWLTVVIHLSFPLFCHMHVLLQAGCGLLLPAWDLGYTVWMLRALRSAM